MVLDRAGSRNGMGMDGSDRSNVTTADREEFWSSESETVWPAPSHVHLSLDLYFQPDELERILEADHPPQERPAILPA